MSSSSLPRAWRDVPVDPDPKQDLGFQATDLEVVRTSGGADDHVLVLPSDDDMLRQDAFIVADAESVTDLDTML